MIISDDQPSKLNPRFFVYRELVEELHPLMKEALERRPEVIITTVILTGKLKCIYLCNVEFTFFKDNIILENSFCAGGSCFNFFNPV